ncbi:unnamed protein product, partial [Ectocarpus fasciculatus]
PYPDSSVRGLELSGEPFDPCKHLQLEPPNLIKDLNFQDIPFPFSSEEASKKRNLAYTRPFRVLSDEGVRVARESILKHKNQLGKSDARASFYIRGLGMVSHFHKGLSYSDDLNNLLSSLARDSVHPSTVMNMSHTNIGEIGTGRPVDKWHVDSIDYVLVIVLSDLEDMVGGDLRVLQVPDSSGEVFEKLKSEGVPEELVETVRYTKAGYGIFMQGSKILHSVSEVVAAREPRMSLVNSYVSTRPFCTNKLRYSLFQRVDGRTFIDYEYARHRAWRARGKLQYLEEMSTYTTPAEDMVSVLRSAAQELLAAADFLDGVTSDHDGHIEVKGQE